MHLALTVRNSALSVLEGSSLDVDPEANLARRAAASSWRDFSTHVNKAIPFSIAKGKKRAADLRNGKPVPRQFDIHGLDHESETDGAERPPDKYFKPG